MKSLAWCILILAYPLSLSAQTGPEKYSSRLNGHLLLEDYGREMFLLSDSSVTVLDTSGAVEFVLPFHKSADFLWSVKRLGPEAARVYENKNLRSGLLQKPLYGEVMLSPATGPLSGKKIAIDPGHMAISMPLARRERKFVEVEIHQGHPPQKIQLAEGHLNLATALLLADTLRKLGAEVMLTRTGEGAPGMPPFHQWLADSFTVSVNNALKKGSISRENASHLLGDATDTEKFSFYNNLDLERRAEAINTFMPDVAVVIHYNVDVNNEPWNHPTGKNHSMTFIPGAFGPGELDRPRDRFELLRLLVSDHWEKSAALSGAVSRCFAEKLEVPYARQQEIPYLQDYSKKTERNGVFSRNLSMTRLIRAPLVYGEPLYQDNITELKLLSRIDGWIGPVTWNGRMNQVALCYLEGLMTYFSKEK